MIEGKILITAASDNDDTDNTSGSHILVARHDGQAHTAVIDMFMMIPAIVLQSFQPYRRMVANGMDIKLSDDVNAIMAAEYSNMQCDGYNLVSRIHLADMLVLRSTGIVEMASDIGKVAAWLRNSAAVVHWLDAHYMAHSMIWRHHNRWGYQTYGGGQVASVREHARFFVKPPAYNPSYGKLFSPSHNFVMSAELNDDFEVAEIQTIHADLMKKISSFGGIISRGSKDEGVLPTLHLGMQLLFTIYGELYYLVNREEVNYQQMTTTLIAQLST